MKRGTPRSRSSPSAMASSTHRSTRAACRAPGGIARRSARSEETRPPSRNYSMALSEWSESARPSGRRLRMGRSSCSMGATSMRGRAARWSTGFSNPGARPRRCSATSNCTSSSGSRSSLRPRPAAKTAAIAASTPTTATRHRCSTASASTTISSRGSKSRHRIRSSGAAAFTNSSSPTPTCACRRLLGRPTTSTSRRPSSTGIRRPRMPGSPSSKMESGSTTRSSCRRAPVPVAGAKRFPEGPIVLQGHGNPVRYRNLWIVKK